MKHVPVGRTLGSGESLAVDRVSPDMVFLSSVFRPRDSLWISQQELVDFIASVKRGDFDNV